MFAGRELDQAKTSLRWIHSVLFVKENIFELPNRTRADYRQKILSLGSWFQSLAVIMEERMLPLRFVTLQVSAASDCLSVSLYSKNEE